MTAGGNIGFDAGAYWRERVGAGSDLAVVGHRAMGPAYNGEIYARRIEALELMLVRHARKPLHQLRVLDIGCGSGFYTQFWRSQGVHDYVGLDISVRTIEYLAGLYPDYDFVCADVAEPLPGTLAGVDRFDVITVFDVLYHIVDNPRVESAIANIGGMVADNGLLFVMDQLCKRDYQVSRHVIYRARDAYFDIFDQNSLTLKDSELLFHFLVPPITEIRVIDLSIAAVFKIFGCTLRLNDRLVVWAASALRRLDARMRARGIHVRNCEFLVFARKGEADG